MIFYKDKEYILEADLQTAKQNADKVDLKKGFEQLKADYAEYAKTHKDVDFVHYAIDMYNNKIDYDQTVTTTETEPVNYNVTDTTAISQEVEQSAENVITAAENAFTTISGNA